MHARIKSKCRGREIERGGSERDGGAVRALTGSKCEQDSFVATIEPKNNNNKKQLGREVEEWKEAEEEEEEQAAEEIEGEAAADNEAKTDEKKLSHG